MMSRFHTLQSSTTREKLLKSLRESLRKNGIDPFKYITNEEDDIEHASIYLQTPSLIQSQNCGNILGSEKQHHGMTSYNDQAELGHQVHMQDAGGSEGNAPAGQYQALGLHDAVHHQQYNHQYIGCGHNVNILHNEDINGLTGYVHDDYYRNDLIAPDQQCMIGYGHEGNRQNMLESSTYFSFSDDNVMLSSLEPASIGQLVHCRMQHSLTSLAFDVSPHQDDCWFPTEVETSQPTLHLHPAYPHLHSQHNYQEFQQNPHIGMAASMQYITHDAICNDNAINVELPVAIHPSSTEAQVSKTTCCAPKAASLPPASQHRKRPRLPADTNAARRNDCLDESDGDGSMEDAVDIGRENCSSPNAAKASGFSSNLVCERKRRKKINEALYALRSVVPIVSKMDKASIMSDALTYAEQLRKQVDDLQTDIRNLQVGKDDVERTSIDQHVQEDQSSGRGTNNPNKGQGVDFFEEYFQSLPKHKILELTVFNMESNTYQLRICCKKGPGDLLQLARVIEALDFDILNSSVTSVGDQSIINTVVVKVDTDQVLKPEEVKEMMLEIVSKYGLHV